MRFLFVYPLFKIGGIETLMARMTSWLDAHGHTVTLAVREDGPARTLFDPKPQLVVLEQEFERLKRRGVRYARDVYAKRFGGSPVDVIMAFSGEALWVAAALKNAMAFPTVLLAGAWNPWEYSTGGTLGWLRDPSSYLFQNGLPPTSRLFMSHAVKSSIEARAGRVIQGKVWPLPVDATKYAHVKRHPKKGLIVSIGRLADIKTYNFYMVEVVRSLVEKGYDLRWDVYGDGPQRNAVQQLIDASGLTQRISLLGELTYVKIPEVLSQAYAFVGMGTSLIEAGFCRVPSIPAIASVQAPLSYGYLPDLPEYACGEILDRPWIPIADLLSRLMDMPCDEYHREEERTFAHVLRFEMEPVMLDFLSSLQEIPKTHAIWRPSWLYILSQILRAGWGRLRGLTWIFHRQQEPSTPCSGVS